MYETIRIVKKLKPKYVIWENVKNLISKKHRHNFDAYLEIMESLGYKNYYQVLNAKDYGIPQNRERVFTISIRNDIDKEFIFPDKQELKLKLKDMLEDNVDEKYYLSDDKIDKISHWKGFQKPFEKVQGKNSIVPTLTARGAGEEHNGMITFSDNLKDTTNLQEQCLNIKNATKKGYQEDYNGDGIDLAQNNLGVCVIGNYMPSGHEASRIVDKNGLAPTVKENHGTITAITEEKLPGAYGRNFGSKGKLQDTEGQCDTLQAAMGNGGGKEILHIETDEFDKSIMTFEEKDGVYEKANRVYDEQGLAPTLLTQQEKIIERTPLKFLNRNQKNIEGDYSFCVDSSQTGGIKEIQNNNIRIRKLTPKECWRLMGFDDEDFEKAAKVNSNSQLYKQARKFDCGKCIRKHILKNI